MKFKFNISYVLITFASIAQGMMWVNLFSLIHDGFLAYIGGIPAGFAIVGILVRSANILPRVQSKRARNGGWVLLVAALVVEPVVLGVVNWWFMPAELQGWFISYIMAGGASLVISLVLVLGALVDRSLVTVDKLVAATPATEPATGNSKGNHKSNKKKVARQPITDQELLTYFAGNPGATDTQVAEHFGVTRQAIGKRREKIYSVSGRS